MKNFNVIAEIGCTHIGSLDRAKELAKLAKLSGADILKTQKRNPEESTPKEWWNKPHPNSMFSYGETYLDHRKNVELDADQHASLKEYCEDIGLEYSSSVWDMTSAKQIAALGPKLIKIPSACNCNWELLNFLLEEYDGIVHISTGMIVYNERDEILAKVAEQKHRVVIYHCTSGYPVPFESLYLKEIPKLCKLFPNVGFSNHGYGIAMEPVAYALGARWFERHFIDDRMFKHTDAACSLEPQGLSKLVRDLKAVQKALADKPLTLDPIEKEQRDKLRGC